MYELQAYEDEMEEAEAIDWEALFERVAGTVDAPIDYEHLRVLVSENLNGHPGTIIHRGFQTGDLFWVDIRAGRDIKRTYVFSRQDEVDIGDAKPGFEIDLDNLDDEVNGEFICESTLVDYFQEEREFSHQSASHLPRESVERVVDYLHRCIGFSGWKNRTTLEYKLR